MTQRDMAGYLGVDVKTIRNWKKDRPKLYEIVMKGFAFDEMIEKSEKNLGELRKVKDRFENEK